MDPSNPGQTPGEGTPPVWGPPPAPDQPGYGAPPAPYGAPPAPYGAPPAPYGAPPAPYGAPPAPYGAPPGWGAPAPTTRPSRLPRVIGVIVVIVALAVGGALLVALNGPSRGKVLFSTNVPTANNSNCRVDNQVSTVSATTSVYATYIFAAKRASDSPAVQIAIAHDGATYLPPTEIPVIDTRGYDCFGDTTDLSSLPNWGPGVYHFSVTSAGSVISSGDLTVK